MINTCLAYIKWDTHDPHNFVSAGRHRIAIDTQQYVRLMDPHGGLQFNLDAQQALALAADRFSAYLKRRMEVYRVNPIPLSLEGAMYVINKLKSTQPKAKIMKLMAVAQKIDWQVVRDMKQNPKTSTSIFIKNEGYPALDKPPRLICFPAEGEKLLMSMAFYHIMHPCFSSPYCTKEIPEELRPRVIEKRLEAFPRRYVSDYTAWECTPNKLMMQLGEHRVLRPLVPDDYHFLFDWIEKGGQISNKNGVKIRTPAVQYSGRYTTSLSNTIRNKILMDAVAILLKTEYRGVFEGDDSLTSWPDDISKERILSAMHKFGVHADIDQKEEIGSAGYCSMWWNQNYELLYNPIKALAKFPFSSSQLAHQQVNYRPLLAAKAMSMAYKAPGCPIVSAVVKRYIGVRGYMETRCEWEKNWFKKFTKVIRGSNKKKGMLVTFSRWDLIKEPTKDQREFFYHIFGIDSARQITAERLIMQEDGFSPTLFECLNTCNTGENIDELKIAYSEMLRRALEVVKRN